MNEIWRDIKGYENRYAISNKGRIYSYLSNKMLSQCLRRGYLSVCLITGDGRKKMESVHRLVAIHFLDNPNNLPQVNHKDENKLNNEVDNLEWCTAKDNMNYGTRNERISKAHNKSVYCINNNTVYPSATIAAKELGLNRPAISECCNGKRQSVKGYRFKFAD